ESDVCSSDLILLPANVPARLGVACCGPVHDAPGPECCRAARVPGPCVPQARECCRPGPAPGPCVPQGRACDRSVPLMWLGWNTNRGATERAEARLTACPTQLRPN